MTTVMSSIVALVARRLVMSFMTARSRLMNSSGTRAKGMPKERTT